MHRRCLMDNYVGFVCACVAVLVTCFLLYRYYVAPASLARKLHLHYGLHVLPYRPPAGNVPDIRKLQARARLSHLHSPAAHHQISAHVLPFHSKMLSEHQGGKFVYWAGLQPMIVVTDPEEVKQILFVDFKSYAKAVVSTKPFHRLLGHGLLLAEGEDWHKRRTMLRPAFFPDKLKGMIGNMHLVALQLTEGWRKIVANSPQYSAEVEVARDLNYATADILARTSFGSDYQAGKAIFENQDKLLHLLNENSIAHALIPGFRYLPTPNNIKCWKVERSIHKDLLRIVHSRTARALTNTSKTKVSGTRGDRTDDLLSLLLASNDEFQLAAKSGTPPLTAIQIIDECKTFFFAGHETTAHLLTWTMMLLSLNPDWQEKLREEIWEVCGRINMSSANPIDDDLIPTPDTHQLNQLKLMSMVLNESLRLYPPIPEFAPRVLCKEGRLGEVQEEEVQMGVAGQMRKLSRIPGMGFAIPTLIIQRDTSLWGEDANEFRPQRFTDGVAKAASHPSAFLPFGFGPRICIGQTFALLEAKLILIAILQRFRFRLSPSYKHAPISLLTMKPQHGMQLILDLLV